MNKARPLISVIVLNWNGRRFIDPFMKSIKNLNIRSFTLEVLFVDNNSSDDSVDYYSEHYKDDKIFKLVQNDGNYGYAKGNNLGIKQATGDYILVCNNDIELDPDSIVAMLQTSVTKDADLVVPKLMFLNQPGIINNAGSKLHPGSNWPIEELGANQQDRGQFDSVQEITAFCGACVLFKRSFLETVGLYDPRFFMYFEDGDLSWRGQTVGKKYYYCPTAVANHYHTGTSKEGSPLFTYFVARNRILILTKNARLRVIASVWKVTLKDYFIRKIRNLLRAVFHRYPRRQALKEASIGAKIILGALVLTPYCLLKRSGLIKEPTI